MSEKYKLKKNSELGRVKLRKQTMSSSKEYNIEANIVKNPYQCTAYISPNKNMVTKD